MLTALQIALGLFSGIIFFALLRRAFSRPGVFPESEWFDVRDIVLAFALSSLFGYLAWGLFASTPKPYTEKDISGSIVTQLFFGAAMLGYVAFRQIPLSEFFGVRPQPWWKSLGIGSLLMLGILPFIGILADRMSQGSSDEQEAVKFFQTTTSLQARLMLAFMAVVVAPVVEEVVFRGLLYRILRGYFGKLSAMFFISVLFASIHGNLPTFLPLTLLSFALVAGLEVTGSLLVSIAMHATFNAVSLLFILLTGKS